MARPGSLPDQSGKARSISSSSTRPGRWPWQTPSPWRDARRISSPRRPDAARATSARLSSRRCRAVRPAICPQGYGRQPTRCAGVPCRRAAGGHGLFLGESRRMHPSVCRFISESIYEGRLGSHVDCVGRGLTVPSGPTGLITSEAASSSAASSMTEISSRAMKRWSGCRAIYQELIGRLLYGQGWQHAGHLALEDFLFIAPYNAQVRALQSRACRTAHASAAWTGFKDRKRRSASCLSASSYGEYGSRGLAFILDRNRVNVAISRAQCLAVVVADPRIAGAIPGSIDEMMLINLFCKLMDGTGRT